MPKIKKLGFQTIENMEKDFVDLEICLVYTPEQLEKLKRLCAMARLVADSYTDEL